MKNQSNAANEVGGCSDEMGTKPPTSIEELWNSTARAINKNMREIRSQLRLNNQLIEQMKSGMLKTLSYIRESCHKQNSLNTNLPINNSRNEERFLHKPLKSSMKAPHKSANIFSRPLSVNMSNFDGGNGSSMSRANNYHNTLRNYASKASPVNNNRRFKNNGGFSNHHNLEEQQQQAMNTHLFNSSKTNNFNLEGTDEIDLGESTVVSDSDDDEMEDSSNLF